ncbi:hypothetical protein [Janthinobacterium sp. DSP2-3-3]|uniref:hypothetical protein n=1 Tax=Janthinobacterium sp. DSP2-3-3 TaxID=2804596 RepID=UPI003CFA3898
MLHPIQCRTSPDYAGMYCQRSQLFIIQLRNAVLPAVRAAEASRVTFNLGCDDNSMAVPVQLYWHAADGHPSETLSVRFMEAPGSNSIDLATLPEWQPMVTIGGLPIALDSPDALLDADDLCGEAWPLVFGQASARAGACRQPDDD